MNSRPMALADVLRRAARKLNSQTPPPALQARVREAAQAAWTQRTASNDAQADLVPTAPARTAARRWQAWGGASAAAVIVLGTALLMLRPTELAAPKAADVASDFVRLAPPDRWPADPSTAWLVSTEMSGDRLAALGLPFDPARAGDRQRAELLVASSGDVLALRLLP